VCTKKACPLKEQIILRKEGSNFQEKIWMMASLPSRLQDAMLKLTAAFKKYNFFSSTSLGASQYYVFLYCFILCSRLMQSLFRLIVLFG
jgi:hypothetical protein